MTNYIDVGLPEYVTLNERTLDGWFGSYQLIRRPAFLLGNPNYPKAIRVYMDGVCLKTESQMCNDVRHADGYAIIEINDS